MIVSKMGVRICSRVGIAVAASLVLNLDAAAHRARPVTSQTPPPVERYEPDPQLRLHETQMPPPKPELLPSPKLIVRPPNAEERAENHKIALITLQARLVRMVHAESCYFIKTRHMDGDRIVENSERADARQEAMTKVQNRIKQASCLKMALPKVHQELHKQVDAAAKLFGEATNSLESAFHKPYDEGFTKLETEDWMAYKRLTEQVIASLKQVDKSTSAALTKLGDAEHLSVIMRKPDPRKTSSLERTARIELLSITESLVQAREQLNSLLCGGAAPHYNISYHGFVYTAFPGITPILEELENLLKQLNESS